jgi:hypothetical protein
MAFPGLLDRSDAIPIDATAIARAALREGINTLPVAFLDERALEIGVLNDYRGQRINERVRLAELPERRTIDRRVLSARGELRPCTSRPRLHPNGRGLAQDGRTVGRCLEHAPSDVRLKLSRRRTVRARRAVR